MEGPRVGKTKNSDGSAPSGIPLLVTPPHYASAARAMDEMTPSPVGMQSVFWMHTIAGILTHDRFEFFNAYYSIPIPICKCIFHTHTHTQATGMKKFKGAGSSANGALPNGAKCNSEPEPFERYLYDMPQWDHDFKGYDLKALEIPRDAYPQDRPNLGKHGYTLVSPHTGAVL